MSLLRSPLDREKSGSCGAGAGRLVGASRGRRRSRRNRPRFELLEGRQLLAGVVAEYPVPTPNSEPFGIAAGPDGALWFTESGADKIGRITTAGAVTEFPIPTAGSDPFGIAAGPDGNLWFTEAGASRIGVLDPTTETQTQLAVAPAAAVLAGRAVTLTAVVVPGPDGLTPTGDVTFVIDGAVAATVPLIQVNGQATATFSTSSLAPGTHMVAASYGGSGGLDPSVSAVQAINVVLPPRVVAVQRYGFHAMPTRLVLFFSTALDPATAQDVGNYRILGPNRRAIRVVSAQYLPGVNAVVLSPAALLNIHRDYSLTVNGSTPGGVADIYGNLLDGAGTGQPGSDYVTTIDRALLVIPPRAAAARVTPSLRGRGRRSIQV
jgi:hypothetical protein